MKVLHITNAFPYDENKTFGVFIKEQIDSIENLGLEIKTVFINAQKNGSKEYLLAFNKVKTEIKSFKPDIIHCHHQYSLFALRHYIFSEKVVLSLLGSINKRSFLNQAVYYSLRFFVNIEIVKDNPYPQKNKSIYIPNGVNTEYFIEKPKQKCRQLLNIDSSKGIVILFVSGAKNNPIKRYDKFKRVIKILNDSSGLLFQPLIMTNVSRDLVVNYYNAADILLLTSDHEGSPNCVKEAMSCNLPIVSTNVGDVPFLFKSGKGLFYSKNSTTQELVDLVLKATKIKRSNGRKLLVQNELSMLNVAQKISKIYINLLNTV